MAEMFDFVDKTLHQMPFAIAPCVVVTLNFGPLMRRNNGLGVLIENKGYQLLSSIATVSNDERIAEPIQQGFGLGDVMALASR